MLIKVHPPFFTEYTQKQGLENTVCPQYLWGIQDPLWIIKLQLALPGMTGTAFLSLRTPLPPDTTSSSCVLEVLEAHIESNLWVLNQWVRRATTAAISKCLQFHSSAKKAYAVSYVCLCMLNSLYGRYCIVGTNLLIHPVVFFCWHFSCMEIYQKVQDPICLFSNLSIWSGNVHDIVNIVLSHVLA